MINLKQLRKKHKLTQQQLADLSGYCRRTVQKHECGEVPVKARHESHYRAVIRGIKQ